MVRRSFSHGMSCLFISLLILGLTVSTTLTKEAVARSGTSAETADEGIQASKRLEGVRAATVVHQRHWQRLKEISDVVGSGVSLGSHNEPIIRVFTARHGVEGIPYILEGVPVHTEVSGRIYALQRDPSCDTSGDLVCTPSERWPLPVPTGVSVGHPAITAGTIGARVTNGTDVFILSNNHILANVNQATPGDPILQPGDYDGGNADDAIANLTQYEQIAFCDSFFGFIISCPKTNTIDAAIALSDVTKLGFSTPVDGQFGSVPGYGAPTSTIHPVYGNPGIIGDENLGLLLNSNVQVQKYGRTTGLTTGNVNTINATVDVCYDADCMNIARFINQLIISPGTFSAGGDSGSLVVDTLRQPVGLLFAGSDTITIINRIDFILNKFGVTIDGDTVPEPTIDVAITGIDLPTSVHVGQSVPVTVTVESRGTQATGDFNVTLHDGAVQVGTNLVSGLAPGASETVHFSWTPATAASHTLVARHDLTDDNPGNNTYRKDVSVLLPPGGPQLQLWKGLAYTDHWTTVQLGYEYGDEMIVVCSPSYDRSAPGPAIARVRNAAGSSFEVGLGRPWFGGLEEENFSANVYCMVVRQGVYTVADDGVKMEAVKLPVFTLTDHAGSWSGQRQTYQNAYTRPVVVGQVLSSDTGIPPSYCPDEYFNICEQDWSVFWSRGTAVTNPPTSSALYVGRHTGEDGNDRAAETLAYVVIESGKGTLQGRKYVAALGGDTVRGMGNAPPYKYSLSGLASASVAIVSQSGMDAADGGWAILYGPTAVSPTRLRLAIDEDWYLYPERSHTTEQVAYIVFE